MLKLHSGQAMSVKQLIRSTWFVKGLAVTPTPFLDITAGDDIFAAIVHERRVELALEESVTSTRKMGTGRTGIGSFGLPACKKRFISYSAD